MNMVERTQHPMHGAEETRRKADDRDQAGAFEAALRDGQYTNIILEGYARENVWSPELVARDILQNFFDANGYTLDGVDITVVEHEGVSEVTVSAKQEYPWRSLVSFGSGYKQDTERSAGGKHQGTKDVVVMLLREYGCEEVEYASGGWEMTFYKDALPHELLEDKIPDKKHGVYLRLSDGQQEGNVLRFKTRHREMAEAVMHARDLFYHSGNPDFRGADFDNEAGGFRLLPEGERGNVYVNGQRVSYRKRGEWETLPGLTVWSKKTPAFGDQKLVLDRERSVLTEHDVSDIMIPFLLKSLEDGEQELLLEVMRPSYSSTDSFDPKRKMLEWLVRLLIERQYRHDFDENDFANDVPNSQQGMVDAFQDKGYNICLAILAKIGMKRLSEMLSLHERTYERAPDEQERARLDATQAMVGAFLDGTPRLDMSAKGIRLFVSEHPALEGKYDLAYVWIRRDALRAPRPHRFIATYLHELCHRFGNDESATFSYKLTDVLAAWTQYLADHPDALAQMERTWQEAQVDPHWESVQDFIDDVGSFIAQAKGEEGIWISTYTRDELEQYDVSQNRLAERMLDALDKMEGGVNADNVTRMRDEIRRLPDVVESMRFYESFDVSEETRAVLEEEKRQLKEEILDLRLEKGRLESALSALLKDRSIKRGRKKRAAQYTQQIQVLDERLVPKRQRHAELEEQAPDHRRVLQLKREFAYRGVRFPMSIAESEEDFFYAAARLLHADVPVSDTIDQGAAEKFRQIEEILEEGQRESTNPSFRRKRLAQELDLTLAMTRRDPSATNLRYGEILASFIPSIEHA